MPLRNALLSLSALPKPGAGSTQPRAEPGSTDDTTVVWIPAEPNPINPADVLVIVLPIVYFILLFAPIIAVIVLKRREKRKQGRCSCGRNSRQRGSSENTDLEAADGSGYALLERHSSESDNDSNSSQLELPLSTDTGALDETSKGKRDVLDPPPYSER